MKPQARHDSVYVERLATETILYDKDSHQAHCLNATVAAVWEYADGTRSVGEIAELLEEKLGIPRDCEAVLLSLQRLEESGLMVTPPEKAASVEYPSRRDVARKLATAGISAAMMPFVASVLAPTPAMAASASGPSCSIASYQNYVGEIGTDVATHYDSFLHSPVAQTDLASGFEAGNQGVAATLQGNNVVAQNDFQTAISDFDGTLKAIGLGPL